MNLRSHHRDERLSQCIAQEAARLMEEEGVSDYLVAKRKAAERLGLSNPRNLPRNTEIEQARDEFRRLFRAHAAPSQLRTLRKVALHAMEWLAHFQPRLAGAVLSGATGVYTEIEIHLFAKSIEEVRLFLDEYHVPYEQGERRVRMGRGIHREIPVYGFRAGDWNVNLFVFPLNGLHQAPLSPVDGRPERRATLAAVHHLLEQTPAP